MAPSLNWKEHLTTDQAQWRFESSRGRQYFAALVVQRTGHNSPKVEIEVQVFASAPPG